MRTHSDATTIRTSITGNSASRRARALPEPFCQLDAGDAAEPADRHQQGQEIARRAVADDAQQAEIDDGIEHQEPHHRHRPEPRAQHAGKNHEKQQDIEEAVAEHEHVAVLPMQVGDPVAEAGDPPCLQIDRIEIDIVRVEEMPRDDLPATDDNE